jgi:hypothetical protein
LVSNRSGARLWLLAFAGFWLLHASWAFAAPYNGPPDEMQHVIRAVGVVHGELVAEKDPLRDWQQSVPRSLIRGWCFPTKVEQAADCDVEPGGDQTTQRYQTTAGRYNPVYHLVTAWPLAIWPSWSGIIMTRLLTGAAMAALLACAVVAAVRWTRHRALLAGLVVAVTPMTAHLGGSVNPNGIEIAAGVALFAALIAVVHEQKERVNRAAVALAGISASVLVTPRFTGILWLAVILGAVLIPSSRLRLKELIRDRSVRIWSAVVVAASVAAVGWTFLVGTTETVGWDRHMSRMEILKTEVFDIWPKLGSQMIFAGGWAELFAPGLIYVAWLMALGLLLAGAVIFGRRSDRWRLAALFVASFAPLILLEISSVNQIGWFNQGRYFLPGAVGLPLFAAHILAHRGFGAERLRTATRFLAGALLPIQVVCLVYTMARWDSGLRSLNPFNGSWQPPAGVALPIAFACVAVVVLFAMYWQASRIPATPTTPAQDEQAVAVAEHEPVSVNHG